MSEGDYCVQVSISLPPTSQYEKGDMLNIRAQDPDSFLVALYAVLGSGPGEVVLQRFRHKFEAETLSNVAAALGADMGAVTPVAEEPAPAPAAAPLDAPLPGDEMSEKQRKFLYVLAKRAGLSDAALKSKAASIVGRVVLDLSTLSRKEATALIDALKA